MSEKQTPRPLEDTTTPDLGAYGDFWSLGETDSSIDTDVFREEMRLGGVVLHHLINQGEGRREGSTPGSLLSAAGSGQDQEPEDISRRDWNKVVLSGSGYDREAGQWPSSNREWRETQQLYREKDHLGTIRATMGTHEDGVYAIDRKTGRSTWRDKNGSLKQFPRKTRKSIKRTEKAYQALVRQLHHGETRLHDDSRETTRLPKRDQAQRGENERLQAKYESLAPTGASEPKQRIPTRPSTRAGQNSNPAAQATRNHLIKPARTARGRRYQAQQARNRQGVV